MKITIGKRTVRGERMFVVSHKTEGGKRKRSFFKTKTEAETHAEELLGFSKSRRASRGWDWMCGAQRDHDHHQRRYKAKGVGLRAGAGRIPAAGAQRHRLKEAAWTPPHIPIFRAERKRKLVSHRTEMALKSNVGRFVKLHPTKNW